MSDSTPKTKFLGNFIVPTDDVTDADLVIFYLNPGWKGGSIQFKDVLKDNEQKIATAELSLHVIQITNEQFYTLPKSAFDQLSQLLNDTKDSLGEEILQSETEEEEGVEENKDEDQSSNEMEEQQLLKRAKRAAES